MKKIFLASLLAICISSPLCAAQSTIIDVEGKACMGDDKSRNQTEQAAITDAKRRAVEFTSTFLKTKTEVKDYVVEKDLLAAYANAEVKVIRELERVWYKDPVTGDCYKVKIKAEVIPDEKALQKAAQAKSVTDNPAAPAARMEVASKDKMAFPLPDKPSIAVLPFVNMSGDPNQEFFSDGLTEDIITALSKHPGLFVIARNSSSAYKGKPVKVKQVAEDLGVQYVIEGSIQRSGNRVRITAQLIDALKGHHIWSERYDREFKDLFSIQDDITKNIITAVHVKLTDGEKARIFAKGTSNLQAYLKTLEAQWLANQGTKEGVLRARQLAEEAIALDPNYAQAYMTLGGVHGIMVWLGMSQSPGDSLKRCIELTQKAVALDDSFGAAHASLGYWLVMARQYDRAVVAGERGMALEPNSDRVLQSYAAILMLVGRREESIPLFREALRLNPKPPNLYYRHFGAALRDSGRYEEAIAMSKKAIEQEPKDTIAYMVLASSYQLAGREEEARTAAGELLRINPVFSLEMLAKTTPHKDRAVAERFIEALRKAGLK